MYTLLLVDSDQERAQLVASGVTDSWKVRVVGSTAEVLQALRSDDSIARIVCSSRFGCNETAVTLHVQLCDWLTTMRVDMAVTLWEEDHLTSLEELYFLSNGVDLIYTWLGTDHALVEGPVQAHGLVS